MGPILEDITTVDDPAGFIVDLSAGGQDLEKELFVSSPLLGRLAVSDGGASGFGGLAGGSGQFNRFLVRPGQQQLVHVVPNFGREC